MNSVLILSVQFVIFFSLMVQGTSVNDPVFEKRGILVRVHEASYRFLFFSLLSEKNGMKIGRVTTFSIYNPE